MNGNHYFDQHCEEQTKREIENKDITS